MSSFFDLNTPEGYFRSLLVLYLITIALRSVGFEWAKEDHALILGAMLTLIRSYSPKS